MLKNESGNNHYNFDMGADAVPTSTGFTVYAPNLVARDAFSFSLNYFSNDYKSVSAHKNPFVSVPNVLTPNGDVVQVGNNLYNGNIAAMSVNIGVFNKPILYGYRYDQLNRIVRMDAFKGLNATNNTYTPEHMNDYQERISYDPNGNILTYKRNGSSAPMPGMPGGLAMDDLGYEYIAGTNQLKKVNDYQPNNAAYTDDIDHQTNAQNYKYDLIGNLIQDKAEGIYDASDPNKGMIEWTVYGKISKITKIKDNITTIINYTYDASGNRISKNVNGKITYYVRDATGNVMSVYEKANAALNSGALTQTELHLYGSSRLGIYNVNVNVEGENRTFVTASGLANNRAEKVIFTRGNKFFVLTNHLGNVLVTVTDKRIGVDANNDEILDYFNPDVASANDYHPKRIYAKFCKTQYQ